MMDELVRIVTEVSLSGPQLRQLLKWPRVLPLEEERVRLLHEVIFHFTQGLFSFLI